MKARQGGLAAALLAAAFATVTFADGVVYQNDFATRTSAGAVPYGGWRAVNYVAGQLLANTNFARDGAICCPAGRMYDSRSTISA